MLLCNSVRNDLSLVVLPACNVTSAQSIQLSAKRLYRHIRKMEAPHLSSVVSMYTLMMLHAAPYVEVNYTIAFYLMCLHSRLAIILIAILTVYCIYGRNTLGKIYTLKSINLNVCTSLICIVPQSLYGVQNQT